MNNNLKLITTETFGDLPCNFYRNMNDDIFLTREQIGTALGYSDPSKAIQKIHLKHKNRLENLCVRIVENRRPQNGGVGVDVETVYYTERGVMEICRWSRQPKADEFMDWVWDIVEQYRNGQLMDLRVVQPIMEALNSITATLNAITKSLDTITETLSSFDERITKLEETAAKKPNSSDYKYSYWASKMFPKYELLIKYFNLPSHHKLYKELYHEFKNMYPDIDLNQVKSDYCYENKLDKCFTLDAIEHTKEIRKLFEGMVDGLLDKYGLDEDQVSTCYKTIFNE
jgi:prophage antirepressor-like protein